MKAMQVRAWGQAPETASVPVPGLLDGHSLVRVMAATVGHLDRTIWRGQFLDPPDLPYVPGIEGSGIVEQSSRFPAGTRVWFRGGGLGTKTDGSWREYCLVPDPVLDVLPEAVSFETGAGFFSPCTSAWVALHDVGHLAPQDHVLVTGAAGAAGSIVCQLALAAGAKVTGIVGAAARAADLAEGVRPIVVARDAPRLPDTVRADLLIDTVGGAMLAAALPAVVPGGRAVLVGYVGGSALSLDLVQFIQRDVPLLPLNMLRREAAGRAAAPLLLGQLARGSLQVRLHGFRFDEAGVALEWLESPGHRGRALLVGWDG